MPNCQYLNGSDFQKTNFNYSDTSSPNCKIEESKSKYRITFRLPTGKRVHYYKLDTESYRTESNRSRTVREFESLVRSGYFPRQMISKLNKFDAVSKKGQTAFLDAVEKYYTTYNKGRYFKRPGNIKNQRPVLAYLLRLLQKVSGKKYLEQITTDDLGNIEDNLQQWCENNGRPIGIVTTASYKRILKSFFNCLAKKLRLNMNPGIISSSPESNGHENEAVGTRTVIIPRPLLDSVDRFPFVTPHYYPDRKEMIHLYRTTGITKGEMSTLCELNLYPDKSNFDSLRLMDKPMCPTIVGMGFQVKTHNRHMRIIPLDDRAISYIKFQLEKHCDDEIYGRISIKGKDPQYKKYRYLFPVYHHKRWQRCNDFIGGIQRLLDETSKHFNLGYRGKDYTVHDFRTTLNEEMGDKGISSEDRAYILGHSKEVNETNYMNSTKRKELRSKMALPIFREKMLNQNPILEPCASQERPRLRLVAD